MFAMISSTHIVGKWDVGMATEMVSNHDNMHK